MKSYRSFKKTVLITGAGRGLGAKLAEVFHQHDWRMILNTVTTSLPDYKDCIHIYGSIRKGDVVADLKSAADDGLNLLINNAGVYTNSFFTHCDYTDIGRTLQVNLIAPIQLTLALWPVLKKSKGMVIFINSLAGLCGGNKESLYCASKFGLRGFAEALQFDGTFDGIKVLNINLGAMKTDMTKGRKDWDKFIDPMVAAGLIYDLSIKRDTIRVPEITIARSDY